MKKVMIAVDLQNDFLDKENGALYVEDSEKIIENVTLNLERFIAECKNNRFSHMLMMTQDYHDLEDSEISNEPDYLDTFPPHCIANTWGCEFHPKISELLPPTTTIFKKNKFSIFEGNYHFKSELKKLRYIEEVVVMGLVGEICIKAVIDGLIGNKGRGFDFGTLRIKMDSIACIDIDREYFERYVDSLVERYDYVIKD